MVSRQELAASGGKNEGTLVPRQNAAGEINVTTEPQGTIGNRCRRPVSKAKRPLFLDKVRLVK